MVDAPADVALDRVPRSVVEVGVLVGLIGMVMAEDVDEAPRAYILQRGLRVGMKVHVSPQPYRVIDVDVGRGYVEIP